jgi:hypothetical protein
VEAWLERLRKYWRHLAIGTAVLAWAVAFKWGFASSEWAGFGWSTIETRGGDIAIKEKAVESAAERAKRLAKQDTELKDALRDLKREYLGDSRKTRGNDLKERAVIPSDVAHWTQRDACFQMKLEYPEKFGDVDCMSPQYDDTDPWFRAPRH